MNLLSKLLNRKPETSANLASEIEARKVALSQAQARVSAAASARAAALADLDGDGMARADVEAADAARAVELGTKALDILTAAHAKALDAEQAEAKAAVLAVLVERRRVLGQRYETEWRRAAATMASVLVETATLARDISEAKAEREVEALPEVRRDFIMRGDSFDAVSTWLDDALSARLTVPESAKEQEIRERQARRKSEEDERRRAWSEAEGAKRQAEREAEVARAARSPFYPSWRDHLTDAAR